MLAPHSFVCLWLKGGGVLLAVGTFICGDRLTPAGNPWIAPKRVVLECPILLTETGERFRWLIVWKNPLHN